MWKDTLCHGMYIQSFEVRCREVFFKLLSKVEEGEETVRDQDVLKRKGIQQKDVSRYLINSCYFMTLITLMFAHDSRAHTSFFTVLGCVIHFLELFILLTIILPGRGKTKQKKLLRFSFSRLPRSRWAAARVRMPSASLLVLRYDICIGLRYWTGLHEEPLFCRSTFTAIFNSAESKVLTQHRAVS